MTYSIVARDPDTGELGVAVQSHFLAVGTVAPWALPGVGAAATQAMAEVSHGPLVLELVRGGREPEAALTAVLAADPAAATRQVAVVDTTGRVAVHTGERCIAEAGHVAGDGFTAQANMMWDPGVPERMADAFRSADGDLAGRLLAALQAAEEGRGDIRGRQSAALLVVPGSGPPWQRRFDLRIDDHPEPLEELGRLLAVTRAYRSGEHHEAVGANPELWFWQGVRLAAAGHVEQARPLLERAYAVDEGWRELVRRLPAAGLLPVDGDGTLLAALGAAPTGGGRSWATST